MVYGLGPRASRVSTTLQGRIAAGTWSAGTSLPSIRDLAVEFGVAPMTIRQVLAVLEKLGIVSRQVGRGTFVLETPGPAVLIMRQDQALGAFLPEYITRAGSRSVVASRLQDALRILILADDQTLLLILCDHDAPHREERVEIMRTLRAR